MLMEYIEDVLTPCPRHVRVMGYLREAIGIGARYRRCRGDWQPHLDRSRQTIRDAMGRCSTRRKVVVFGSGRLYDVPLEELAAGFTRVVLVDLVQPLPVRWQCRTYPNVELVSADVTLVLEALAEVAYEGGRLPVSLPRLYLDDPDVDLVISLNILSQLPIIPCRYLRRWNRFSEDAIDRFGLQLMRAHIEYLQTFAAAKCLIADVAFLTVDDQERVVEQTEALRGISLPWSGDEWVWRLAPRGEKRGRYGYYHRVRGMIEAKAASDHHPPSSSDLHGQAALGGFAT